MKKILAFVLALLLALCTACVGNEPADDGVVAPSPTGGGDQSDSTGGDEAELTEIELCWYYTNGNEETRTEVERSVNAITEAEIGVHVNFNWIVWADYSTQLSLAIANGEQMDWAGTIPAGANFQNLYTSGAMMDITDLLHDNAPDVEAMFGQNMLNATSVDGRLYAVGTYRPLSPSKYLVIDSRVTDAIGMTEFAKAMTTWAEWETLMQAIVDGTDEYAMGHPNPNSFFGDPGSAYVGEKFAESYSWDTLGDSTGVVQTDNAGNVSSWVENPDYVAMCKMIADWNAKGYIYPDSAFSQDEGRQLVAQGIYAASLLQSEYGVETSYAQSYGAVPVCIELTKCPRNTNICQKFGCFIPATSAEPEAALRFTNLLYTNAELMNLLVWGIEGETYVVKDGVAAYPEGKDAASVGYHTSDFMIGNQYLLYPWAPSTAGFRTESQAFAAQHPLSPYLGCVVDVSDLGTELAAINAVVSEFRGQLESGLYSDDLYNEYLEKLNAAGVDTYLAHFQATLSDFMA